MVSVCTCNALCISHSLSVARSCLFCKALTNKPDFIYAVSFIMAWVSPRSSYHALITLLICCYIPIGLCILSMSGSLPCSPRHAVVGVACVYLLFGCWDIGKACGAVLRLPYLYLDISIARTIYKIKLAALCKTTKSKRVFVWYVLFLCILH